MKQKKLSKEVNYAKWGWIALACAIILPLIVNNIITGLTGKPAWIYDLASLAARGLISATGSGLFFLAIRKSKLYLVPAILSLLFAIFLFFTGYALYNLT